MSEAVYVHSLSPYAIHFGGDWGIRWYGLAYVLGLFLGVLVLKRLARSDRFVLPEDRVTDFLTYGFIFGVMLGGRLGYFLFYDGIGTLLRDPLAFFKTLGGGMSSHGGILGLVAFTFYYSWRHKVSWPGLGDGLVAVAPIGLFFGRMANFVNGELYGRVAPADSRTAMVFPSSIREEFDSGGEAGYHTATGLLDLIPGADSVSDLPYVIDEATRADPAVRDFLAEHLPARYPSQLFEAALEGLLLFLVLISVRLIFKRLP
ncbi:prolipoprotein diacylglyceryl transferase, partial [Verrucomicrobiales bacterium]|nr:prolipoprotein diacylglyceryl transferase [Verrucomicrobiales bacterium]